MQVRRAVVLAALGLAGCNSGESTDEEYDCATETRDDEFSAGMSRVGDAGYEIVLTEALPAPPSRGDNAWKVRVLDASGAPVSDLAIGVTPCMVDHGHGTPISAETTAAAEGGEFSASPVNLWMPGLWRVSVVLSDSVAPEASGALLDCATGLPEGEAEVVDTIEFAFCIDG
jgi:hypothetical protein